MIYRKRFELALERLESSDWARFERFASAFLTAEFPELRTMANPSGDEGRDAQLYSPADEPAVMLQYSVTEKWATKIRGTAKRLQDTFPNTHQLIYVTNQQIGSKADSLKKSLRKEFLLGLDIRDRSYFMDRFEGDGHLEAVAENLAKEIVDPYLQSREIIERKAQALSPGESRAALVFLGLQWEDDSRDKGLTKTAFDALVRTALRYTSAEALKTREQIHDAVVALLPAREKEFVARETDKSLARLTKNVIRHYPPPLDAFCLTYEEAQRIKGRLAETELQDRALSHEIEAVVEVVFTADVPQNARVGFDRCALARTCIEKFLLQRGELFVAALDGGQLDSLGFESVESVVREVLNGLGSDRDPDFAPRISLVVEKVLSAPGAAANAYLRDLADAYTLLAFLRETPDVQSVVKKMFSVGEIWLDTSVVLPLLAEDLLAEELWQFRRLLAVAKGAGLKLRVSPGVIEEVVSHTKNCLTCATGANGEWRGTIPYLFASFIATGRGAVTFSTWLQKFRGNSRPEDDISEYLERFQGVATEDIAIDAVKTDPQLRYAVKEAWTTVHNDRRNRFGREIDPMLAIRLAEHDTENYIGVIVRRRQEGTSAFGFTSWWLTLDHMAFAIVEKIKPVLGRNAPPSPVMSADFLSNYLAFGPLRERAAKTAMGSLPVWMDSSMLLMTPELLDIARKVRSNASGMDEHVIQRMVRDALDAARRRTGSVTQRGLNLTANHEPRR
jgi:hypothetical protein